jgi:Peptidase_C39 like family
MRLRRVLCIAGLALMWIPCAPAVNRDHLAGVSEALSSPDCDPPVRLSLQVPLHPQETSKWCWAASGQMVMHYLGHNVSQCEQANKQPNPPRTNCPCDQCKTPVDDPPCVEGGWPEFEKYGFSREKTFNEPLTWDQLRDEIACGKRPFAFSWHWAKGGGHVMVVRGYKSVAGTNYVRILDPLGAEPCKGDGRFILYDHYDAVPGDHTHWDDYHHVRYTGGP